MNVQQNTKKGFTIIEVVLVLAIAALIFLMIFVALPALQRGQRNTARKNDVGTVASAINTYRTSNGGVLPTAYTTAGATKGLDKYIDKLSQIDLSASGIKVSAPVTATGNYTADATTVDKITVYPSAKCDTTSTAYNTAGPKSAAVFTTVEISATGFDGYCQDT